MKPSSTLCNCAFGALIAASLALSGCGGGSNSGQSGTTQPPSTFPTEIVYTADAGTHSVQAYELSSSGNINSPVTVTQLSGTNSNTPQAIALDQLHQFLFAVTNADGVGLSVYRVNANGSLAASSIAGAALGTSSGSTEELTVVQPAGAPANTEYVYVASGTGGVINAFSFNTVTDALTSISAGANSNDYSNALSSNVVSGTSYLYSGGTLAHPNLYTYSITPATGVLVVTSPLNIGFTGPTLVAADSAGPYVYSYDQGNSYLYTSVNSSGSMTNGNSATTAANTGNSLAVAPNGSAIYLANGAAGTLTGALIGNNGNFGTPFYSAAIPSSDLVGIAVDSTSSYVFTLNHVSASNNAIEVYTAPTGGAFAAPLPVPLTGASDPIQAVFYAPGVVS